MNRCRGRSPRCTYLHSLTDSVAAELSQLGVTGVELPEFANSTQLWLKELQRSQLRLLPHLVYNYRIWVGATLNQTTVLHRTVRFHDMTE